MIDLLLDVDAGVDDAIAILFALSHPDARVRGITTVAGNVPIEDVTENVRVVVAMAARAGRNAPPIARGAGAPLARPLTTAPEVHGPEGMGGVRARFRREPLPPVEDDAVAFLARELRRDPPPVLVATGPLTNVARLLERDPDALTCAKGLVCMLGSFGPFGNTEIVSEFNAFADPEAAARVLEAGVMPVLVPLDATERCLWARRTVEGSAAGPFGAFIVALTAFYFDYHAREEGIDGGFLHDPLAVAAAIEPELVKTVPAHVRVECAGRYTSGKTIAELRPRRAPAGPPNAHLALDVDVSRFRLRFDRVLGFTSGAPRTTEAPRGAGAP